MSTKFYNGIDAVSQRILNVGDGSAATDAVNLSQLQNYVNGLAFKDEVKVATTANGALATAYANGQTIDTVTLVTGDRILIKNQTTQTENGIYVVQASGAPVRATDADSAGDLNQATVKVRLGSQAGSQWTQGTDNVVIGTSNVTWASSGGGTYTAAASGGLTLTGNAFSVNAGSGIIADATSTRIDPAYAALAKRYSANIGDGSSTSIAVTHGLGTKDVTWSLRLNSDDSFVFTDAVATSTTVITFTFATAPASNALRVTVNA